MKIKIKSIKKPERDTRHGTVQGIHLSEARPRRFSISIDNSCRIKLIL